MRMTQISRSYHWWIILGLLTALTNCADMRPALDEAGLPDPARRMTVMGWYLDPAQPKDAVVMTIMYPVGSSSYQSKTLMVGQSLYQYRLEAIENSGPPMNLPRLRLKDLDTKKTVVLKQETEINGLREFSEEAVATPAAPVTQ